MLYVGLDVHWKTSSLCILNENGQRVKRLTIRSHWKNVLAECRKIAKPFAVCFEASCGYGYLHEELSKIASRVVVAHPGVIVLRTIPGVGPRTAEAVAAYVADPQRFRSNRQAGTYFGLVPCQDASAGVNRLGHITRQGPATGRKLLVEASWQVIRRCEPMRERFERIAQDKRERRKIALIAVAHHLVCCMVSMLKTGEVWRDVA